MAQPPRRANFARRRLLVREASSRAAWRRAASIVGAMSANIKAAATAASNYPELALFIDGEWLGRTGPQDAAGDQPGDRRSAGAAAARQRRRSGSRARGRATRLGRVARAVAGATRQDPEEGRGPDARARRRDRAHRHARDGQAHPRDAHRSAGLGRDLRLVRGGRPARLRARVAAATARPAHDHRQGAGGAGGRVRAVEFSGGQSGAQDRRGAGRRLHLHPQARRRSRPARRWRLRARCTRPVCRRACWPSCSACRTKSPCI